MKKHKKPNQISERGKLRKKSKKQKLKEKCVKLATKIKLKEHPSCVFCHRKATTCHHFIHQSRSNFLRLDERNLIPICKICHCKLHNGYENIMAGILIKKYGWAWFDGLQKDSRIKIKDTLWYWQTEYEELKRMQE